MEYLPIEKPEIPYHFEIDLDGGIFGFEIHHNERFDFFTVTLYRNDELLIAGEKLVYGQPLFSSVATADFPKVKIIPYAVGDKIDEITYANFYEQVFLYIEEGDE